MPKLPKAKIYIDGANMFYAQQKMGWFIAWHKVLSELKQRHNIVEARYYTSVKPDDAKMKSFLSYLDKIGIQTLTKPLKEIKNDNKILYKSNFDVEITADLAFDRANINIFILFSGDSDFDYIVKKLRDTGKAVLCFSSRKTLSWELKLSVNRYYFLEDYRKPFERDPK